jgi:hypothetical protein
MQAYDAGDFAKAEEIAAFALYGHAKDMKEYKELKLNKRIKDEYR